MKSIRFLILAYLCLCVDIQAQNPDQPDRPILQRVSVDPLDNRGHVTIEWTVENPQISSVDVDEFRIFWFESQPTPTNPSAGTNHLFAKVQNTAARRYEFLYDTLTVRNPMMPDPRKTTVAFTVAAVHATPYSHSLFTYPNYCIQVKNEYDSCKATIRLAWHPYKGWQSNTPPNSPLVNYRVLRIPEGGSLPGDEVEVLSDLDTFYIVPKINENEKYTFYIEARRRDGMTSTGYQTTKITAMPRQPSYIIADGTQYNSDGLAEIRFKLDPASETYSYELLGSRNPDHAFVTLGTFNIFSSDTVLTDDRIRQETYYYQLQAWHVCKNDYTYYSNKATALWLSLKQNDQVNQLKWDPYKEWQSAARYELHRRIGNNPDEIVANISDPFDTEYGDNLEGVLIDGEICYWVTAVPESSASSDYYAISNTLCIIPESDIFIPQAFTPETSNNNQEFKVFFSYPPQEFSLYIYDRIGANVFQTNFVDSDGVSASWDGRLKNGKPANEGVYVYYIKYRTAKGRLVEKRGTIILIRGEK
jgi:hypothetical protein